MVLKYHALTYIKRMERPLIDQDTQSQQVARTAVAIIIWVCGHGRVSIKSQILYKSVMAGVKLLAVGRTWEVPLQEVFNKGELFCSRQESLAAFQSPDVERFHCSFVFTIDGMDYVTRIGKALKCAILTLSITDTGLSNEIMQKRGENFAS